MPKQIHSKNTAIEKTVTNKVYSLAYRRLHSALAFIIITLLVAGQQFNFDLTESYRIHGLKAHSTLGTAAFIIALIFIIKRFVMRSPTPAPKLPLGKLIMARTVQLSLYSLALIIPLSGIICALHSSLPVYFLGFLDISSLQVSSEASFTYFRDIHMWATRIAMLLVSSHAGAAFYHHLVIKDGVLKSMATPGPYLEKMKVIYEAFKHRKNDQTMMVKPEKE